MKIYQFAKAKLEEPKEGYLVFVDDSDERSPSEYALPGFELTHSSSGMDLDDLLAEAVIMRRDS